MLAVLMLVVATLGAGQVPHATLPVTVAQLSTPNPSVRFSQLYKLHYLNAKSVADVVRRSFANVQVGVIPEVNAITVVADAAEQQRIADALAQLDVPAASRAAAPAPANAVAAPALAASTAVDVVTLRAAIPGLNGAPSSSASDIAGVVLQALSPTLPDLHITVYPSQSQLLLTGSPDSIRAARELIDKLDALPKMVILDVTIVEVDENVSKNLGLSLTPAVVSTTYTETTPAAPLGGGTPPPLLGLQPLSRTPLSLGLTLNLLIQNGKAKVLADPKLTTISGRTASLRAGDNISILTTAGGSVGTVATTQLVTFNTGVQLDITPVINAGNFISVTMHPIVNNLTSILNGVPQISTRDVQTTVALQEGQSLIIGGLIEDSINRSDQRIPVLGYLPLIGPLFTQTIVNGEHNELIIMVTPHVVDPLAVPPAVGPATTDLPTPAPLPTLAPDTVLPPPLPAAPPQTSASYIVLPSSAAPGGAPSAPAPNPPLGPGRSGNAGSASANAGSFVYGQRPASLPLAGPHDPPRILFVEATPQVVQAGTTVTIAAITSTNVARVSVQLGAATISLTQSAPGVWNATVPFSVPSTSQMSAQTQGRLTAVRGDGVAANVVIPLTVVQ